jgi:thiamine-phosphate pyrophosphorylase
MTKLRGLYAITPDLPDRNRPLGELAVEVLAGGARVIQYRDKGSNAARRISEARMLVDLCHQFQALLIVNDDLGLAAAVGADGVHLGRDDADPRLARSRLGSDAIIGVSCYNSFDRAQRAREAGADYTAFGRFFASCTKPEAIQADPALLHRGRRELNLPLVAIGGITPENGGPLITAGADMLAVVNGVFAAPDVRAAAEAFAELFRLGRRLDRSIFND